MLLTSTRLQPSIGRIAIRQNVAQRACVFRQRASFQTSPAIQKMKKALLNNPIFAGMEKARAIEEQRAKQGDATRTGTRMVIKSTNEIIDFSLPPVKKPPITTKEFWLYPLKVMASAFKTHIFMPIRLYNYLKRVKKPSINRKQIIGEALETYQEFNKLRAAGNLKDLEEITSGKYFQAIVKETRERTFKEGLDFKWSCENLRASLLSLRFISVPHPPANFLQVVLKFTSDQVQLSPLNSDSLQKVDVVNQAGAVVGGAPPRGVVQYLGFERDMDKDDSKWLVVEELTQPQEIAVAKSNSSAKTESEKE